MRINFLNVLIAMFLMMLSSNSYAQTNYSELEHFVYGKTVPINCGATPAEMWDYASDFSYDAYYISTGKRSFESLRNESRYQQYFKSSYLVNNYNINDLTFVCSARACESGMADLCGEALYGTSEIQRPLNRSRQAEFVEIALKKWITGCMAGGLSVEALGAGKDSVMYGNTQEDIVDSHWDGCITLHWHTSKENTRKGTARKELCNRLFDENNCPKSVYREFEKYQTTDFHSDLGKAQCYGDFVEPWRAHQGCFEAYNAHYDAQERKGLSDRQRLYHAEQMVKLAKKVCVEDPDELDGCPRYERDIKWFEGNQKAVADFEEDQRRERERARRSRQEFGNFFSAMLGGVSAALETDRRSSMTPLQIQQEDSAREMEQIRARLNSGNLSLQEKLELEGRILDQALADREIYRQQQEYTNINNGLSPDGSPLSSSSASSSSNSSATSSSGSVLTLSQQRQSEKPTGLTAGQIAAEKDRIAKEKENEARARERKAQIESDAADERKKHDAFCAQAAAKGQRPCTCIPPEQLGYICK